MHNSDVRELLTAREREVLRLVELATTEEEITVRLGISKPSVRKSLGRFDSERRKRPPGGPPPSAAAIVT